MDLFSSVFQSVFKRRDVKILLSLITIPALTTALAGVSEQQMSQNVYGGFLNFFSAALELQYQLVFPALILGFIVSSIFRDEINSGIMFLYKDIKRSKIFHAKLMSLFAIYGIYFIGTLLFSLGSYFFYVVPKFGFQLFATENSSAVILQIISIIGLYLILITLVAFVSIKKRTLVAVLTGVLFNVVAQTAPLLNGLRYVFPNSYPRLIEQLSVGVGFTVSIGIIIVYFTIAYVFARKNFNRIEF